MLFEKVQVPLSVLGPEDGPFLCYNEKRDIQYKMDDKSDLGIALKKAIQEQGCYLLYHFDSSYFLNT